MTHNVCSDVIVDRLMIISSVYMLLQLNSCLISEMTTRLSVERKVAELHKVSRKPLVMVEILMLFLFFLTSCRTELRG